MSIYIHHSIFLSFFLLLLLLLLIIITLVGKFMWNIVYIERIIYSRQKKKKNIERKMIRSIFFLFTMVFSLYMNVFFCGNTIYIWKKRIKLTTRDTNIERQRKVHKCIEQDIINEFFLFDLTTVFFTTRTSIHIVNTHIA